LATEKSRRSRATSRNIPPGPNLATKDGRSRKPLLDAEFAGGQWLRFEKDGQFWGWTGTHWAVIPDKILQRKILKIIDGEFSS
jgi:hypothetical protein